MSYNRKITEYALLPNGAFPLDARSHFKTFAEAQSIIVDDIVTTAEDSDLNENRDKLFYVGQIITTTNSGTWQVSNATVAILYLHKQQSLRKYDVYWGADDVANLMPLFHVSNRNGLYTLYEGTTIIARLTKDETTGGFRFMTRLQPFSGSGGGGGSLSLTAVEPLKYKNSSGQLSLTLDNQTLKVDNSVLTLTLNDSGGLTTTDNGLSLKLDTTSGHGGLSLSENGLSLKLAKDSDLSINNNGELDLSLNVVGTHTTIEKTGHVDIIKVNNYIYQEI